MFLFFSYSKRVVFLAFTSSSRSTIHVQVNKSKHFHVFSLCTICTSDTINSVFSYLTFKLFRAYFRRNICSVSKNGDRFATFNISRDTFSFFTYRFNGVAKRGNNNSFGDLYRSYFSVGRAYSFFHRAFLNNTIFQVYLRLFVGNISFFFHGRDRVFRMLSSVPIVLIRPRLMRFMKQNLFQIRPRNTTNDLTRFYTIYFRRRKSNRARNFITFVDFSSRFGTIYSVTPLINATSLRLSTTFFVGRFVISKLRSLMERFHRKGTHFRAKNSCIFHRRNVRIRGLTMIPRRIRRASF